MVGFSVRIGGGDLSGVGGGSFSKDFRGGNLIEGWRWGFV